MSAIIFAWAPIVGGVFAGLAAQLLLSRIALLLLGRMGRTFQRLLAANILAYVVAASFWVFLQMRGAKPGWSAAFYSVFPALIWLVVDALILMRRRAKLRDAVYISRMR